MEPPPSASPLTNGGLADVDEVFPQAMDDDSAHDDTSDHPSSEQNDAMASDESDEHGIGNDSGGVDEIEILGAASKNTQDSAKDDGSSVRATLGDRDISLLQAHHRHLHGTHPLPQQVSVPAHSDSGDESDEEEPEDIDCPGSFESVEEEDAEVSLKHPHAFTSTPPREVVHPGNDAPAAKTKDQLEHLLGC